jgi:hypothetical protein
MDTDKAAALNVSSRFVRLIYTDAQSPFPLFQQLEDRISLLLAVKRS